MYSVTITANLVSALFIFILIAGQQISGQRSSDDAKYYRRGLYLCLLGLVVDTLSYAMDGRGVNGALLFVVVYLAYITIDLLVGCYAFYLCAVIREKDKGYCSKFPYLISALCALDLCMMTYGSFTGKLFSIVDGTLVMGPMADYISVIPMLCVGLMFILLLRSIRALGIKDTAILCTYLIVLGLAGVIQLIDPDLELGYVGAALCLTTVYVMIQYKAIEDTNTRARIYDALSSTDVLTGLKNRRGYEEALSSIDQEETVGAVFCDMNSLKEVNDSQGHEAGDAQLKRIAGLLTGFFPDGEVFRISGDEFVILIRGLERDGFSRRMGELSRLLDENDRIAAFGYETGQGSNALEIVRSAERRMYDDKRRYYEETGKDRRRS